MRNTVYIVLIVLCLTSFTAYAGSQAGSESQFSFEDIAAFSKQVEKKAAEKRVLVFIIARIGRPLAELPMGVRYTHTAFAVYSDIQTKDGKVLKGYAIYNLYQNDDNPGKSHLSIDFPVDFFMGVHVLEAGIIIPKPKLQEKLFHILNTDQWKKLHVSNYSILANPNHSLYQNCTEYVLDTVNAAVYQTFDRKQLKANTKAYFTTQKLDINPMKLLFGSMFRSDVSLRDQKNGVQIATFQTISRYMQQYQLAQETFHVRYRE